ncbi:MAG TPA: hypothetical protein VH331_02340 [Allosphingosinicella sp.]|jgi:hypothetical protein|nr:hypothetical protein [Allosphingosinicella sp.]
MPDLLHEYWEDEDGGTFGPVSMDGDRLRLTVTPGERFVFSLWAPSQHRAMQLYQERLGYGDYVPVDGVPDHFYTDEEAAEQETYLRTRKVS